MWVSICFDWCSIGVGSIEAFSTDRICFLFNWKSCREFFLKLMFMCSNSLFQKFFNFFSLYTTRSSSNMIFCHFPLFFLQGFSLPRPVRPLYHSFCIYFHFSCIKSYIIWEISNLWNFWGFWWIKPFLSQLINGLLLGDVINTIFGV